MKIGIYIYPNAEVLDFSGPFEVFSTARRLQEGDDYFEVFLVAEKLEPVLARGGYSVNPHFDFENCPKLDCLIVVGGVHTEEMQKNEAIQWIESKCKTVKYVASVCTGVFLLAKAGVVNSKSVTTHWEDINDLRQQFPSLTVIENQRWVDEGKLITSGGISAGIDMSLHLVAKFDSYQLAVKTARQMEFDWTQP